VRLSTDSTLVASGNYFKVTEFVLQNWKVCNGNVRTVTYLCLCQKYRIVIQRLSGLSFMYPCLNIN